MLRRRKKLSFLLLSATLLFAFHGVLHPLFHAGAHGGGDAAQESVRQSDSSGRYAHVLSLHCPVCSGIFQGAESPEWFLYPVVPHCSAEYPQILLRQRDNLPVGFRGRAPPCFA